MGFSAFGSDIGKVQATADAALAAISEAQIFHSTLGLAWSDAYVGTMYPFPSNFGIGIMAGMTRMDSRDLSGLLTELGLEGTLLETLAMPAAAAELRLGGLYLPFDLGFKIDMFPDKISLGSGERGFAFTIGYSMFGADVRYAAVRGRRFIPDLSIGVGFNHIEAKLGFQLDKELDMDIPKYGSLEVEDAAVGISWEATSVDFRIHASRRFFILTPYVGLGTAFGWTKASYLVSGVFRKETKLIYQEDLEEIKDALALEGLDDIEFRLDGFSSEFGLGAWIFRAYIGMSVAFGPVILDFSHGYNLSKGSMGTIIGLRLQR